jgi:thioredoxin reductase (NADPH)
MEQTDVLIVGAGPIGIELALHLKKLGIDYLHLEAGPLGRTLQELWPPNTRFLSGPDEICLPGYPFDSPAQDRPTAEEYLAYLRGVVRHARLEIRTHEKVTQVQSGEGGFELTSLRHGVQRRIGCKRLVLATGDMHRPRLLDVPGRDLPHVHHTLQDPGVYFGCEVLIVGGLNSAVEAAIRLFHIGARVSLSYRRDALDSQRISHKLLPIAETLIDKGHIHFLPRTAVVEITPDKTLLAPTAADHDPTDAPRITRTPDFVLPLIGFEADISLMLQAGVAFETPNSPPQLNKGTMETDVPGLYIAGTASAGNTYGHEEFIETSHPHVERIVGHLRERMEV